MAGPFSPFHTINFPRDICAGTLLSLSTETLAVMVQDPHKYPICFVFSWLLHKEIKFVVCHMVHLPPEMLCLPCSWEKSVKKNIFFPSDKEDFSCLL